MDFSYLLEIAKQNSDEAGKQAAVKRYSTNLKPAKKESKGNVKSGAVKAFLARREEEERQKEIEAQKKKSELLSLRSQNTKNSKKAKLMVSRTKDNDYSKIKLTEEEEQLRKQREIELQRRMLTDKIERMKARIEMEEKEKLLPRKRKRKTQVKHELASEEVVSLKDSDKTSSDEADLVLAQPVAEKKKKLPPPPQPSMNFHDLLKLASQKQHEPIPAPKIIKQEERPMTQKEKRMHEEQQLRKKGLSVYSLPQPTSKRKSKTSSENKVDKKQMNTSSSNGHNDSRQVKKLNNVESSVKSALSSNKLAIQEQNSQYLSHKTLPPQPNKPKYHMQPKPSRYIEEDEEYDDDLADFIDDGPIEEEIDVSSQIREIFKYDSKRYADDDDDDDNDDVMESSFVEQMKEECRSAKLGRMEDLEDMRKEEEERRQKLMKLKKKKSAR